jgi:hypothetical protein
MDAVRTSETSVYFKDPTRRYIKECCYLVTHLIVEHSSSLMRR